MFAPLGFPKPNVSAGFRPLAESQSMLNRSIQRLATGQQINAGKDNPAGLIAAERLRAAIRALDAESRAIQREASYLATTDGALAAAGDMLGELKGLAVEAANTGAMGDAERRALDIEAASIVRALEHTTGASVFGGERVFGEAVSGQIGGVEIEVDGTTKRYTLADVGRGVNLSGDAALVAQIADRAVSDLATLRGGIGATISRDLGPRSRSIGTEMIQLTNARSIIADTDFAAETAALVRSGLLAAASLSLFAFDARNSVTAIDLLAGAA